MILILLVSIPLVVFILHSASNSASYSDDNLIEISKSMKEIELPYEFPHYYIKDKNDFLKFWNAVTDDIYQFDRVRNVVKVNMWCYCVVKYYTECTLKYGNSLQKNALRNFVKLLERNKLI